MTSTRRQLEPVEQIVDLQRVRPAVSVAAERRRLARVIRSLRAQVEVGIPKHRAARLLGISPQALERWVLAGEIPTTRKPGSTRELIDRDALVRLLAEVCALQDAGEQRPVSKAIRTLRTDGRLRPRPRPNQPARELRYEHAHSTPAERVRAAVALSQTLHTMAERARARNARGS